MLPALQFHCETSKSGYFINPFLTQEEKGRREALSSPSPSPLPSEEEIKKKIDFWSNEILKEYQTDDRDWDMYQGSCGVAYAFWRYQKVAIRDEKMKELMRKGRNVAEIYLRRSLTDVNAQRRAREVSIMTGQPGPFALATVFFHSSRPPKSFRYLRRLLKLSDNSLNPSFDVNELLYGRTGYLYSLLFVLTNVSSSFSSSSSSSTSSSSTSSSSSATSPDFSSALEEVKSLVIRLFNVIIEEGERFVALNKSQSPLMYSWHGSRYLGGAHGLSGILHVLLHALPFVSASPHQLHLLQNSILYLISSAKTPSGNFATQEGGDRDTLVQFCHGCPSPCLLFLKASQVFPSLRELLLSEAEKASDIIWKKGVLIKGPGLCHGVAGNGYVFLALYRVTKEEKHLVRALRFAQIAWSTEFTLEVVRRRGPDHPYSLFEGFAGALCFYLDLLRPMESRFPLFDLP